MMLTEGEVYVGCKALLNGHGWECIAGQPPSGSDHLPVVEVKWPERSGKGSLGALKPDLIGVKSGALLLVECKPKHSPEDVEKLRSIISDPARLGELREELRTRSLLGAHGLNENFPESVYASVAHSGDIVGLRDIVVIQVQDMTGKGSVHLPKDADKRLRELF
jgi:hypothetical protein